MPVILPRIKTTAFLTATAGIPGMTPDQLPIHEPLIGDLILTYAIDLGSSYVAVSRSGLVEHAMSVQAMRRNALGHAMEKLKSIEVTSHGPIHQVSADDNLAACCLLFPEFWEMMAEDIGSPIMAIFPHRDAAFFGKQGEAGLSELFHEILGELDPEDNHNLSRGVYLRHRRSTPGPLDATTAWPHEIGCWKVLAPVG